MEKQQVDLFLMTKSRYFETRHMHLIKQALLDADEEAFFRAETANYKEPAFTLILSLIGGMIGIDRFFIRDTGLGILKLITLGGFGIWYIADLILIHGRTREVNFHRFEDSIKGLTTDY